MILWGPPGVGKTTLARLLADQVDAPFSTLSAVMSGVADVRAVIARAREWIDRGGRATVLFVDEIHRFNKGQQDALLPQVEDGTLTLIGATTENPYFEVNSALLSRLRVFRLEPLSDEELGGARGPGAGRRRGASPASVELSDDAREHLVAISAGDARAALNVLEAAAGMAGARRGRRAALAGASTLELVEAAAQQRILAYDRAGDGHYGTVSAFIKSMRGNDPDATLYWLATMVAAGEDPRFIVRRIVICASEDVGNADPRALQVAVAAAGALELVGLPEAQYALAQAAAYVAARPSRTGSARPTGRPWRTSSSTARSRCRRTCCPRRHPADEAATASASATATRTTTTAPTWSSSTCPTCFADRRYYSPSDQGMERLIGERLERLREARTNAKQHRRAAARRRGLALLGGALAPAARPRRCDRGTTQAAPGPRRAVRPVRGVARQEHVCLRPRACRVPANDASGRDARVIDRLVPGGRVASALIFGPPGQDLELEVSFDDAWMRTCPREPTLSETVIINAFPGCSPTVTGVVMATLDLDWQLRDRVRHRHRVQR